tara:strand:- start:27 stop:215 length:189 start_codon:yes stop_codon:yes gene_type:complete
MKEDTRLRKLEKKVSRLEKKVMDFMNEWGPDVQRKRAERDERWDEMVRVLTIQERNNERTNT